MRLVTSNLSCGAAASSSASAGAASTTCSRLSTRSRSRFSARKWPRLSARGTAPLSLSPSACAIVGSTSSGSAIGASATKNTPCGKSSTSSAAACSPSRVLPVPPGPVSVNRRTSSRRSRSTTAATSRSRPISGVGWTGRFVGRFSSVRKAGNSFGSPVDDELREPLRPLQVPEPMLAKVAQRDPVGEIVLDQLACRLGDQHLPAVTGRADPSRAMHLHPHIPRLTQHDLTRVHPHPDRDTQ